MVDDDTRRGNGQISEILPTSGLITLLGAVVSTVIAVVALGEGSFLFAGLLGAFATTSFAVSVACFFSDSNRTDDTPLPFPSWLRTDADPAAELSAAG